MFFRMTVSSLKFVGSSGRRIGQPAYNSNAAHRAVLSRTLSLRRSPMRAIFKAKFLLVEAIVH
jgi:hypothetical protein